MNQAESLKVIDTFINELGGKTSASVREITQETQPASRDLGMGALMQGCKGFEIGGMAAAPQPAEPQTQAAAPDVAAISKALSGIGNKELLLSLLQYYAVEASKAAPSRSMLKTTKEQIMKNWPPLAFTPLFTALDGAVPCSC